MNSALLLIYVQHVNLSNLQPHKDIAMGNGASFADKDLVYSAMEDQKLKPLDGSDITDLDTAKAEILRLRNLCHNNVVVKMRLFIIHPSWGEHLASFTCFLKLKRHIRLLNRPQVCSSDLRCRPMRHSQSRTSGFCSSSSETWHFSPISDECYFAIFRTPTRDCSNKSTGKR